MELNEVLTIVDRNNKRINKYKNVIYDILNRLDNENNELLSKINSLKMAYKINELKIDSNYETSSNTEIVDIYDDDVDSSRDESLDESIEDENVENNIDHGFIIPNEDNHITKSKFYSDFINDCVNANLHEAQFNFIYTFLKDPNTTFLTAPGGYGKSYCINILQKWYNKFYNNKFKNFNNTPFANNRLSQAYPIDILNDAIKKKDKIVFTATTGSAACVNNGMTIYKFLNCGVYDVKSKLSIREQSQARYDQNFNYLLNSCRTITPPMEKKLDLYLRLKSIQVIIIDEVSMLGKTTIEYINEYLKLVRNSSEQFGGIVIIFCGDLYQLPPVKDEYFFECSSASSLFKTNSNRNELVKNFRQSEDIEYANFLKKIRSDINFNKNTNDIYTFLSKYSTKEQRNKVMKNYPINMAFTKNEVALLNTNGINKLCRDTNQTKYIFTGQSYNNIDVNNIDYLDKEQKNLYNDIKEFAIGAKIVVTANITNTIVNGTNGIIEDIDKENNSILIKTAGINSISITINYHPFYDPKIIWYLENGIYKKESPKVLFYYMPLVLGYAITIHKSQGMTIGSMVLNMSNNLMQQHGMLYTALSRVKHSDYLYIENLDKYKNKIKNHIDSSVDKFMNFDCKK